MIAVLGIIGATIWHLRPSQKTLEGNPSIAVLPFDAIDDDEATKRFAMGTGQDIVTDLSRYRDIDVIGWNSSSTYAGGLADVRQVGRDLNVRYVLRGSVQRDEDQIRVTTDLLDATTAVSLWSERWDRPVVDLFSVQAEISNEVTSHLGSSKGAIPEADRMTGLRLQPQNLTAYETYLRNYPTWAANGFHYAYFMAGRYKDALRILERQPLENYIRFSWIVRAAVYAELGRDEEAKTWVAKALAKYPELTIEGFINEPGWSDSERKRIMDAMQHAGFPPCALPGQLDGVTSPIRIPECVNSKDRRPSAL